MKKWLLLLLLAGCGSSGEDNNHGYGFEYDAQGTSGLRLRHTSGVTQGWVIAPNLTDPTYYEQIVAETQSCAGMTAPAPFVILVPIGALGSNLVGFYFDDPSLILLDISHVYKLRHEMIHYLLDSNLGDLDPNHTSPLFNTCGLFVP